MSEAQADALIPNRYYADQGADQWNDLKPLGEAAHDHGCFSFSKTNVGLALLQRYTHRLTAF